MNSGLVGLMMQLMHTDNSEKNRIAAEKRQTEREAWAEKQRASLWQHQEDSRIKEKGADREYEVNNEHRKQGEKDTHVKVMAELAKTNVPFDQLNPDHQVAMSSTYSGDLAKTAEAYEQIRQAYASGKVASDITQAKRDAVKAMDEVTKADALRPTISRDALAESNLKYATNRAGGVLPGNAANDINNVSVNDDASMHRFPNPSYRSPAMIEQENAMKAVEALKNKNGNAAIANAAGFSKKATDDLDPNGMPVVKIGKNWTTVPAAKEVTAPNTTIGGGTFSETPAPVSVNRQPLALPRGYEQYRDVMTTRLPGTAKAEEELTDEEKFALRNEYLRKALSSQPQQQQALYFPQ